MAKDQNNNVVYPGAPSVGLRNVGSYQVSGHPFITGSSLATDEEKKVTFPYITKKVTIIASGSQNHPGLRIYFAAASSGNVINAGHYLQLDSHEDSIELDVKCKEIYIASPGSPGAFKLYASLTNIPTHRMYALTGSGITDYAFESTTDT
tara:strand:+ start:436 stop:885 length:450 start_codon:yes stop_codon:yes gene_type:complete